MDTLFFFLSKIGWALISPDSLIVILIAAAWLCQVLGWQRWARRLLATGTLMLVLISFLPLGEWLLAPLENRFPANAALPADADGIIVLGGALDAYKSSAWQQAELDGGAERMTNFVYLAGLYPAAQLVFSGGSGSITQQQYKEADAAQVFADQMGLASRAILFESESRNTVENVSHSKGLVNPQPGDEWIVITSAFHMPRAVGVFCKQDWVVTPYPVDHRSNKGNLLRVEYALVENLGQLRSAISEWLGLVVYRITGRSDRLFPGPANFCGDASSAAN
ncbi:MAG: YdcF family protein [Gammaproteobacteria bacterium]